MSRTQPQVRDIPSNPKHNIPDTLASHNGNKPGGDHAYDGNSGTRLGKGDTPTPLVLGNPGSGTPVIPVCGNPGLWSGNPACKYGSGNPSERNYMCGTWFDVQVWVWPSTRDVEGHLLLCLLLVR